MDAISEHLRVVHSLWFLGYSMYNLTALINLQSTERLQLLDYLEFRNRVISLNWTKRLFCTLYGTGTPPVFGFWVPFRGDSLRVDSWFCCSPVALPHSLSALPLSASLFVRFYKNELFFLSWAVRDVRWYRTERGKRAETQWGVIDERCRVPW